MGRVLDMELNTALLGLGQGHFFSFAFLQFPGKSCHFVSQSPQCLSLSPFSHNDFLAFQLLLLLSQGSMKGSTEEQLFHKLSFQENLVSSQASMKISWAMLKGILARIL